MCTFIKNMISNTNNNINVDDVSNDSRMELDSHANMPVDG